MTNKEKDINKEYEELGYDSKEWLENMYFIIGRKITRTKWEQLLTLVEQKCRARVLKALKEREEGYRAEMIEEIKGMETLIISGRNVDHFPVETAYIKKHDLINIINNK